MHRQPTLVQVTDVRTPGDPSSSPLHDVSAALDDLRLTRPVTILTHQMAWTFKVGKLVEAVGAGPAARSTAINAFARGNHVLDFPGGDIETGRSFADRNKILLSGRCGFAKLALDVDVSVVPIVTAGAGNRCSC